MLRDLPLQVPLWVVTEVLPHNAGLALPIILPVIMWLPLVDLMHGIDGGLKTVPIQVHGQEIYPCHHVPTYQNLSPVWTQWMQEVPRLMET